VREPLTPEALRALTGVSELPAPLDKAALNAAMHRHYPPSLRERGVAGFVLVEVDIDETGVVRDVDVVTPPAASGSTRTVRVTRRADGSEQQEEMDYAHDPAFGPAAKAALREVRFSPAKRDGRPVAFKMRMSLRFNPQP
jgi:outer membrane biosynthesis protein TonB